MKKQVNKNVEYLIPIGSDVRIEYKLMFLNPDGTGDGWFSVMDGKGKLLLDPSECDVTALTAIRDQINEILDDIDNNTEPF